ncbi:MAG: CotH kinase family protein [Defluviitaleaceae bacterium]|nr:CotH kinase family protein [Defluviitaleaceae bacterium]
MNIRKLATMLFIFTLLSAIPLTASANTFTPQGPIAVANTIIAFAENPVPPIISRDSGFYERGFNLMLHSPIPSTLGAKIFYTLDGSPPTEESTRYTDPIPVMAPGPIVPVANFGADTVSGVSVFNLRAILVFDGTSSDITTRNFVMGTDVFTRFGEDTYIFALTSDPHGLFDHHDGIFVAGIDRENFRQAFRERHGRRPRIGRTAEERPDSPANFNRTGIESERLAHVEMFDSTGTRHISQHVGIRVKGGYSRDYEKLKSLELYARQEYGDRNNMPFAFFDDEFTADGRLVDRYRRVRLRNGGSDNRPGATGFIRDELSHALFRQAGYPLTQSHAPAAVFINGEYYGMAWLKSPRTGNHLARVFGGETDSYDTVEGGDRKFIDSKWDGEPRAVSDMHEVSALAMDGFTGEGGEERFEEFKERICLDSLILYYAMQIYINNIDWPNNNIEFWRYFPSEEEKNNSALHEFVRDGKWRVFAQDLEAAWAIWDNNNTMVKADTLHDILQGSGGRWNSSHSSAFLHAMVDHPETRARLANTFVDLIEYAFAPENVISVLDGLIPKMENELHYALRMNVLHPNNSDSPSVNSIRRSHRSIRDFANQRPEAIYKSIQTNLGYDQADRFTVTLTVADHGNATMNTRPVAVSAVGNYFQGTEITITAAPDKGYAVDYWTVNGERKHGDFVTVTDDCTVEVHFKAFEPQPAPPSIIINQVHGQGSQGNNAISHGFIELYNPTDSYVELDNHSLQITNGAGANPWNMLKLTGYTIEPSSSLLIVSTAWFNTGNSEHNPRYIIRDYDIGWSLQFDNNNMVVALVNNQTPLSNLITESEWGSVIDLVGVLNDPQTRSNFVAHYLGQGNAMRMSRQVSARRVNFQNTRDNAADFVAVDYRYPKEYANARAGVASSKAGITDEQLEQVRPRYSGDGQWGK